MRRVLTSGNLMATVDADQHPAEWNGHTIRLLPGWEVSFAVDGSCLELVEQPGDNGCIPNSSGDGTISHEFYVYDEGIKTVEQAAVAAATAILSTVFHEVFEWVTVDGRRLADPHPVGDQNWRWTQDAIRGLVEEYIVKFPFPEEP